MASILELLSGKKVYILAAVGVVIGLLEMAGIDVVPNVDQTNALTYIWAALMAAAGRSAVAKVAA